MYFTNYDPHRLYDFEHLLVYYCNSIAIHCAAAAPKYDISNAQCRGCIMQNPCHEISFNFSRVRCLMRMALKK